MRTGMNEDRVDEDGNTVNEDGVDEDIMNENGVDEDVMNENGVNEDGANEDTGEKARGGMERRGGRNKEQE